MPTPTVDDDLRIDSAFELGLAPDFSTTAM
jgi:hypothetical protein